jgi:hypothetical protein
MSNDVSRVYQYSSGEVTITIRNNDIAINNMKYDKLREGDPIVVDNGQVSVGGQSRTGIPMTLEETMAMATVKETTKELAGHKVIIRPGASFTSKTGHTLSVGWIRISVKKDQLLVNDKSYGGLKQGDTILVENSKVFVSGTAREAIKEDRKK